MTHLRVSRVAEVLGVSDDTVRRWAETGRLPAGRDEHGRVVVAGADLAAFVREERHLTAGSGSSARNRFSGIVTEVRTEGLVAQVEIQAGPHRVVSLMTREAAEELGLRAGELATAVVKATMVTVEATGP